MMTEKAQYMLRTCKADMTSYGGFRWPRRGKVVAPDWSDDPKCGHGLHGFLSGCGNGQLTNWDADAVWMVCRIDGKIVDLGGKIKTDQCTVVYSGDRKTATDKIRKLCGDGPIIGGTATAGDRGTATAGDSGTATAGDGGTLSMKWYDGSLWRIAIAYVGEDGIKANTKYRCEAGKFVEAE